MNKILDMDVHPSHISDLEPDRPGYLREIILSSFEIAGVSGWKIRALCNPVRLIARYGSMDAHSGSF